MSGEHISVLKQLIAAGGSMHNFEIHGDDDEKATRELASLHYIEFYDDWSYYPSDSIDSWQITEAGRKYLNDLSDDPH